jgi:hypothetical protein
VPPSALTPGLFGLSRDQRFAIARLQKILDPMSAIVYRVARSGGFAFPILTFPAQGTPIIVSAGSL